ncbi:MAG TPA: ester cyclase [Blastocatellia bacterium]|nr:ester cyclase [Blastocatellia bacterium]HMZ21851.1 ester cyclase [Blastocatellia bacterium]HNG34517.1 ester cyclase [Blastocatellia bacterium]
MSEAENKSLIARYFAALSGQAKTAAIVAEFSDSQELKQHIEGFEAAFPNYELFADEMIAEADKVVVCARFRGTHNGDLMGIAPTGKTVVLPFVAIYQVAGGQIVSFRLTFDQLDLLKQLGVMQ